METGYKCARCGKYHDEIPMNWSFRAPFYWNDDFAKKDPDKNELTSDFCVIDHKDFFIRVVAKIPVTDAEDTFNWGVWVSLSEENFLRYSEVFGTENKFKEEPYFGWFSNQLPGYSDCLKIKTQVHLRGDKMRPEIVLDHSDSNQLCQEQHRGITMARVHEIIETARKPS